MSLATKIIEMKQNRVNISNQIKAIIDEYESKEMDQTKKDEMLKLENEFDNLGAKILTNEKQLERERVIGEEINDSKPKEVIGEDLKIKNALEKYLKDPTSGNLQVYNALQQSNPEQAGYLVPPEQMMSGIIEDKNNTMVMRRLSNVLPALSGAQSLGAIKRTARMSTFAWGTELTAPTPDSSLKFGKREFKPNPAVGGILVSKTLIGNAKINAEAYIRKELTYDQSEHEEEAFMLGDGAGKPLGIFIDSADGISSARDVSTGNTATEVKFDGLYEAKYSLKAPYRNTASWMFHRTTIKKIMKLKDSEGQYVWQPSVVLGQPDMLLALPLIESEYVPNTMTTGLYVGILGDFKAGYWIVDSLNLTIQALLELYALTNQIYYIGRYEVDGAPAVEEAFARIKLG